MGEKLPEPFGEVEIKMQDDFKNQLQNTLNLWRRKGQSTLTDFLKEAREELQSKLSEKGLPDRWPALITLLDELAPGVLPKIATFVGRRAEPMAHWLEMEVLRWDPYRVEIKVHPQAHLINEGSWVISSSAAMAELAAKWLIEKQSPPGQLKLLIKKMEMDVLKEALSNCTVRCELIPEDFEKSLAEMYLHRQTELFVPVMIFSSDDVLLSQVHFHFELHWSPLLK